MAHDPKRAIHWAALALVLATPGCFREPPSPPDPAMHPLPVEPPAPARLRRVTQALATLDAILSPSWEDRHYSFDAAWSDGEMMASMRDGSGDRWFALFSADGVAMHGLAHEAESYVPGRPKPWVFAGLPASFRSSFLDEPAFDTGHSTWCAWCVGDGPWQSGRPTDRPVDDGMERHLAILIGGPPAYVAFASDYHEIDLALADVQAVFDHEPITPELAGRLNADYDDETLAEDLESIGYPAP